MCRGCRRRAGCDRCRESPRSPTNASRRHDHAGQTGIHVQQQFLQVQEVPGRLGRVRRLCSALACSVSGALTKIESSVRMHQEDRRTDRFDDDERWPDHHFVFGEIGRPGERAAADQLEQLLALRLVDLASGRRILSGSLLHLSHLVPSRSHRHAITRPYSGPEMPPSLRIRQKWTAIRKAATSGRKMTCSV